MGIHTAFARWLVLHTPLGSFSYPGMQGHARTYFDTLPTDAQEQVVRHVGMRPRHKLWKAYLSPADSGALMHRLGPLRNVARTSLSSVVITPSLLRQSNALYYLSIDDQAELNWLFRHASSQVEHILIRYGSARIPTNWLTSISRNCPGLRKLELAEDVGDEALTRLLRGTGKNLQSLTVWHLYSRERIELVSRYCKNITELGVRHLLCESEDLWSSIGHNLERLDILLCGISYPAGRLDPGTTLHGIRSYCRRLTHIYVEEPYETFDLAVAAVYASFGSQLIGANVLELSTEACHVVATACPNLRLDLGHRDAIAAQCRIFNSLATSISFEGDAPDETELAEGLSMCTSITRIAPAFMRYWSADQVSALSAAPLTALEVFEVRDVFVLPEAEAALLSLLATQTCSMRQLTVAIHVYGTARFREIAERNPELRNVRVSISASEENEGLNARLETQVLQALKAFTACPQLKELIIDHVGNIVRGCTVFRQWTDDVADAAVPYRSFGAHVQVGDIDYLP